MIAGVTRQNRRLVGALSRGADLFESLQAICDQHSVRCGELRAIGALERAEFAIYDQAQHEWRSNTVVTGSQLELLSLVGNISENAGETSFRAHATVAIGSGDDGAPPRVVGGQLVSATAFSVEFVIDAFDDLIMRRHQDVATGMPQWKEAIALGQVQPLPDNLTETIDQIDSARVSAVPSGRPAAPMRPAPPQRTVPTAPDLSAVPAPGDIVLHPRFHRCVVTSIEDGGFLHVELPSSRVVRLSLAFVRLKRIGEEGGVPVYEASLP